MDKKITVNGIEIEGFALEIGGYNHMEAPDFCSVHFSRGWTWADDVSEELRELTKEELESIPWEQAYESLGEWLAD